MSSDAYTFVKRRRVGNSSAKLVLLVIAEYVDEHGVAHPSSPRLREDTELSARTITTALDLLAEQGLITRERVMNEKGKRAPDKITLVGYAAWLKGLKKLDAEFAPSPIKAQQAQVQELQEQILQVQFHPQDVVAEDKKSTSSLPANSAPAIRHKVELYSSNVEDDTSKNLFYVEGAVPKRRSPALTGEVERVTEALWFAWPPVARKRHTRQQVSEVVANELRKGIARGDDLIAAGKRHVAERTQSDAHFVKGLVPFIAKGLWQNWAEDDAPYSAPIDAAEQRRRLANFQHDGSWSSSWGPKPQAARQANGSAL